jgi:hypothetical protein
MLTIQEVFDKIVERSKIHVQAADPEQGCLYRAEAGGRATCCFVGALIKDEHYSQNLEGKLVEAPGVRDALIASGVEMNERTSHFLQMCQRIHDGRHIADWEKELRVVATCYGLEYRVC